MVKLNVDPIYLDKLDRLGGREEVPGPPKGWRPRALTVAEKLHIVCNQGGVEWTNYCAGDLQHGPQLEPLKGIQFDHQPAIQERKWDPEKRDTIPPSCDLRYIVALNKPTHATKTAKRDIPEISKTRRLEKGPKAPKRTIKSAGFPTKKAAPKRR